MASLYKCHHCGRGIGRQAITCKKCNAWFTKFYFCCQRCFDSHLKRKHADLIVAAVQKAERQAAKQAEKEERKFAAEHPPCTYCGRVTTNPISCKHCGFFSKNRFCSERCLDTHTEKKHPETVPPDPAVARKWRQEALRGQLQRATRVLEECLAAWQQAGCPDVREADVDRAEEEADRRLAIIHELNRGRRTNKAKIAYLKLAHFTRRPAASAGLHWFVTPLIGGVVFFALATLLALLAASGLGSTFVLGGIGFLFGFVALLCLVLLPGDDAVRQGIATLQQRNSDQLGPLDTAQQAYAEAEQRYEHLAHLYRLRTECERAALEKQNLEAEYQAICDE
jgi:hypothetical protein